MAPTEWVGGRIAAPVFVEEKGGFQADLIVWIDATHDLVVGMQLVPPSEPDSLVADVLRQALDKPMAGPGQPPARIRIAQSHLAELVAPVAGTVPVEVAPTPEIEHLVQVMGESFPGANPRLAELRKLLHGNKALVSRLLSASARLFRAGPWHLLWDSEVLQLEIPKLGVFDWCVSVMGRAKQSWGLVLFRSAAEYAALRDVADAGDRSGPVDLGAEALSLSFSAAGELPALLRRELTELGWDLTSLDVYPLWLHATQDGKARLPTERELCILLAAALGVVEHVTRYREELAATDVPPRQEEYAIETDANVVSVRVTSPHPEVPWARDEQPPSKPAAPSSRGRSKRRSADANKPGRNDPCPCGSGLKYKRCCLGKADAAGQHTQRDRLSVFAKLERFSEDVVGEEEEEAFDGFWGAQIDDERADELDEDQDRMSTDVFDMWFWFDRPLEDGRLVVDRLLAEDPSLAAGERRFLELARGTRMRLYDVIDARPGVSLTLQDVRDETRVTVQEKMGSRQLKRADLVAARIIRTGVSGQPEIEAGLLPMSHFHRQALVSQLSSARAGAMADAKLKEEMPPFFHSAWVAAILEPPVPQLQNTDGEDMVITRTHFNVRDTARLARALDAADVLRREEGKEEWHWSGPNRQGEIVSLGRLELHGEGLMLETSSAARGERGRALVEKLAGDAVVHRATSHEDLQRSVRGAIRAGGEEGSRDAGAPEGIPAEVLEDLTLDFQARHYRKWLDEEIPALDGRTPRQAAKDPARRLRLAQLIRDLEGMYLAALRRGEPAYDPSWMWADLELDEGRQPAHPPSLAHERWAEATPGWSELCRGVAARARVRAGFDDASSILAREELEADLDVRRVLKERSQGAEADDALARRLQVAVNYELHRRKTFWVDEALVYLLAQTDLDVPGQDLRVPFPCFALVFTDRHVLSLCERLLAADASCPLAGHLLHVATVFVTEERAAAGRVLHLGFALDALGADPPHLIEHDVPLVEDARVKAETAPGEPQAIIEGQAVPRSRPLPGLLQVVLNAILYATSAGVEPEVRAVPKQRRRAPDPRPVFSSEEVYYLPAPIKISKVRQMQALSRTSGGREMLHRFMVRGHWRRPAANWKEQHPRWIKPYWKGPDIAAVIERTYKLTP
jgi:hypothetical protein